MYFKLQLLKHKINIFQDSINVKVCYNTKTEMSNKYNFI